MGSIETMMIDSAYSQIGKSLGLPTHAYTGLSDSKCVDAQAGLETGMGAVLGALSGINVISGGGMLNYESTQSMEKLVLDNDICGMAYRMINGISQRDDPIALDLYPESGEVEFLTHPHTLQWHLLEQRYQHIINRDSYDQWVESGKPTAADRASARVAELLTPAPGLVVAADLQRDLNAIMKAHAKRLGVDWRF
jgi:trimethylamine--corrinoid protein Co-methyltransferase